MRRWSCWVSKELHGPAEKAARPPYGPTDILTALLVTFPAEAVMITVPVVWLPATSVTKPADTVAKLELLDNQVATSVSGN